MEKIYLLNFQLPLSGSLANVKLDDRLVLNLSTPSLGITYVTLEATFSRGVDAASFNSLSRDHPSSWRLPLSPS